MRVLTSDFLTNADILDQGEEDIRTAFIAYLNAGDFSRIEGWPEEDMLPPEERKRFVYNHSRLDVCVSLYPEKVEKLHIHAPIEALVWLNLYFL